MTNKTAALQVERVNVSFGGLRALNDVYLEIAKNEVVGLIGPNGAGKTTLFNALCGLVTPDSGELHLNGKKHDFPKPFELVDLGIARTLQGVGLFGDLTVLENVMIGAQHLAQTGLISAALGRNRKDEDQIRNKARVALERVYAGGIAHRRADTLAYPDTKRVAIARALVSEPKILMLDEPAGGLGAQDIEWMNSLIKNLSVDMSVLLIEHHMDVVMSVCSRLYVLNFGEVIASGDAETVRLCAAIQQLWLLILGQETTMSLNVSNLTVHHGAICAVNQVSLAVPTGKLAAVIGANGAGKTTLLRALSGLNHPTHGSIMWKGERIVGMKPEALVRRGISHVSEGKSVIPELTVRENLELGAIWRRNAKESKESIDQVVSIFPRLGERLQQRADTLSGGERQMLAIGRAIMSKPQLLLLDEPSLGLAPLVIEHIFQTIRDLTTSMNLTVLLVEQNAMGALKIADLGIVLNLGKVVAINHAQALIDDPAVRAAYLGY